MEILINHKKIKINWNTLIYTVIVAFYFFYVAKDLGFNTAFVDEAIYATVGEEVLRGYFWEDAISWMGGSYLYPLISATINRVFGLQGLRLFSVFCVLITGILSGKIGRYIGGKKVELLVVFLFFFSATTLNLSQHATYDATGLLFTAISTYTAILSINKKNIHKLLFVICSGVFISLAILSKYVAIFFAPAILLMISFTVGFDILAALTFGIVVASALFIYLSYYLNGVMSYFGGSYSQEPAKFLNLLELITRDLGLSILGVFASLFYLFFINNEKGFFFKKQSSTEKRRVIKFLLLAGAMPVLYHLGSLNARSLWKHMVFTSFFWVPVTSWILYKLYKFVYKNNFREGIFTNLSQLTFTVFILLIITNLWFSFSNHWRFQRSWPSASNVINYLTVNKKPDDKIFAEGSAIYKYHLFSGFGDPYAWSSTWYLEYNGQTGTEAMKLAIQNKEFDYIILNNYFTHYINEELMPDIYNTYSLELVDNYKVSGEYDNITTIWKPKN